MLDLDQRPVGKGTLCAQTQGFNLHAASKVAANDTQGRLTLCKYILRQMFLNFTRRARRLGRRVVAAMTG